jgi:glutamate formiminotransferase
MMRHFFGMASRKSARVCRPVDQEINNDLKKSQSWEVPYQQIKATDCGPRAKEMTQQLFHFMDVELFPFVEEERRDTQLKRAEYKKQHDDSSDLRYRLNKEHQKKKQKKPDSGPNPLK